MEGDHLKLEKRKLKGETLDFPSVVRLPRLVADVYLAERTEHLARVAEEPLHQQPMGATRHRKMLIRS